MLPVHTELSQYILRFFYHIFSYQAPVLAPNILINPISFNHLLLTTCYSSIVTIRQTDFKALVAYSSISHVSIVVLGLFSNTIQGIEGGIILSIAHGLVSPALFILVGGVLYDRFHTRTIRYYRGVVAYIPIFSILFFIFSIFNAAVPLSGN